MLKKLLSVTLIAVVSSSALLIAGCKSDTGTTTASSPYGLTGSSETQHPTHAQIDSKGHYRTDLQ